MISKTISGSEKDFLGLKAPRNLAIYTRNKGISDFGNLAQYDLYEKGYSILVVLKRPRFITMLAESNATTLGKNTLIPHWIRDNTESIRAMLDSFCDMLEYEFRGLDGLSDITGDSTPIEDGINSMNILTKVTEETAITVNMSFFEKSGSLITKFVRFYLRGIRDSRTQARSYYGLVNPFMDDPTCTLDPGYENEVFAMLYMVTDSTYMRLEQAYLLLNCQFTTANTSMYETTKGDISFNEISLPMNCYPVTSVVVNQKANNMLHYLMTTTSSDNFKLISDDFNYFGTTDESPVIGDNTTAKSEYDYITARQGAIGGSKAGGWRENFGTPVKQ